MPAGGKAVCLGKQGVSLLTVQFGSNRNQTQDKALKGPESYTGVQLRTEILLHTAEQAWQRVHRLCQSDLMPFYSKRTIAAFLRATSTRPTAEIQLQTTTAAILSEKQLLTWNNGNVF